MIAIDAYQFFTGVIAFAGLFFYLLWDFKRDMRKLIEVGTKEHDLFRQALLRNDDRFMRNDERFMQIAEKIGELKGNQP